MAATPNSVSAWASFGAKEIPWERAIVRRVSQCARCGASPTLIKSVGLSPQFETSGWARDKTNNARGFANPPHTCRDSFNRRFWCEAVGYLYDVVDGKQGDDPSCRPNQVLAISLRHPVLDAVHWKPVLEVVADRLLTPVGLRSLAPGEQDYQPRYDGDRRARDAAYHQGTVWPWLIGPFIDAWLKVDPDRAAARRLLEGILADRHHKCIGTIGEIFDAEEPFTPRGCVAQAWSVAEVLRAWVQDRTRRD